MGGVQRRSAERTRVWGGRLRASHSPGKIWNSNMQICAIWILICLCVNHYARLYAQLACYFNQFIVLDTTLQIVGYICLMKTGQQFISCLGGMHPQSPSDNVIGRAVECGGTCHQPHGVWWIGYFTNFSSENTKVLCVFTQFKWRIMQ